MVAPAILRAKSDITEARVLAARATAAVAQISELQDRALSFLRKQASKPELASLAELHQPGITSSDGADGDGSATDDARSAFPSVVMAAR
jgi:hypothetical protein